MLDYWKEDARICGDKFAPSNHMHMRVPHPETIC